MTLTLKDYDSSLESIITNRGSLKDIPEILVPTLGKVTGIYAKLDSTSVNRRYYSSDFWTKILARPEVSKRLAEGSYIGTFEHPHMREHYSEIAGNATYSHPINGSHVVKKLWIDGKNVMGESYILNNKVGRALATYLLAKDDDGKPLVEVNMSVRGYSRKDYIIDGLDRMNPNDYTFEGFDAVIKPGIKGARVKMESEDSNTIVYEDYDYPEESILKVESMVNEVNKIYNDKSESMRTIISELNLKSSIYERGIDYDY